MSGKILSLATVIFAAATVCAIAFMPNSDLATKAESVMIKAMARGYECRVSNRDLADCVREQRERWDLAAKGQREFPPFGK